MALRDIDHDFECRSGVLVLTPREGADSWRVVEVDWDVYDSLSVAGPLDSPTVGTGYPSPSQALHAAFDVLTVQSEGRVPAMHEQVQESVRDFVRTLESRGYDRQAAVKILLDMVDRKASDPPKGVPTHRPQNC